MFYRIQYFMVLVLSVFLFSQTAVSQEPVKENSFDGLSHLKIYFDVKADSAAKLLKRMEWINKSYEQATRQGLKTSFVIGIRSHASFFATQGDDYVEEKELPAKTKIEKWLKYFREKGMSVEQCGLSAELFDTDKEDFLEGIIVVKNGYVSIAGYQNRGYAYVPM